MNNKGERAKDGSGGQTISSFVVFFRNFVIIYEIFRLGHVMDM